MKSKILVFLALFTALCSFHANASEIAFEEDASLPIVYLNVAVKAGSVTDPDGQSGITNFMGEMLLRGTRSRSKEQIDLALDQMGAVLGIEIRAEALILRGAVLKSQLDPFLTLVTEILTEPNFPEDEIHKLKSEVISSLLDELGSDSTLGSRKYNEFLFQGHPYGKPTLGKIHDVEKFSRDEVVAQYDRLIQDRNLLVVGSGDTSKSQISDWTKMVAKLRPDHGTAIDKVAAPHDAPARRLLIVDKPDRTQTQIFGGQIGITMTDPDFFRLYLGNSALGGGAFESRMMREIRVKRGWSYGAYSNFRFGLQPRLWQFHLFPASKDTVNATALTLKIFEDAQKTGVTADEFAFAKQSLVNSAGFNYNTPKKRVENKLLERTLNLPDGFMKTYGPELDKVQMTEVNAALKRFLKPDHFAIVVVGTAKDLKEGLIKTTGVSTENAKVVPYTED